MTPAARLQAAIEMLDEVIVAARDDGPPADTIVTRYFKHRRYAGSKDRRAVRELVFRAIRRVGRAARERARGAVLGLAEERAGTAGAVRAAARPGAVDRRMRSSAPRPSLRPGSRRSCRHWSRATSGPRFSNARRSTCG